MQTKLKLKSALAGKIQPIISSLFLLSKDDLHAIIHNVYDMCNMVDLVVLVSFGWLLVPAMGVVYDYSTKAHNGSKRSKGSDDEAKDGTKDKNDEDDIHIDHGQTQLKYQNSYLFLMAHHLSEMSRLALLVYACDCIVMVFHTIGYKQHQWSLVSKVFAKILYTSWIARRIISFKSYMVKRALNKAPENCDKIKMVNRLLDGIVFALLLVKIMDFLSVETGFALTSIAAVGTTGGLIVSLASQEIAKGILSGVEMASSDRFYEGDEVHFGDGTQGFIVKMGFLRTKVRKYDEAVIDIPNSQLGGQRVCNITRTSRCKIITKLRFEYDDIQKLPDALLTIKEEIIESCPKLITKGKPFRAKVSSFERDHVEVIVDCRFELPPVGDEFWNNREIMLLAIDRGVKKCGLQYAKPIYPLAVK